jgi:DNA-binding Lrp family transcriptional regulator
MKYVRTSKRRITQALCRAILEKLERNSGSAITITVKKVVDVLGFDDHATRTEVGRVLARLEELGYLRRCNKGRPAKYLVTGRGVRWVRKRGTLIKYLTSYRRGAQRVEVEKTSSSSGVGAT